MILEIYCDGGSRGNPGPGGAGVVVQSKEQNGGRKQREVALFLGNGLTNNQAEYLALIAALKMASAYQQEEEVEAVKVCLDSELVVKQLKGEYRVKNAALKKLNQHVKSLASRIPMVEFKHVPREQNEGADRLVNWVLDLAEAVLVERKEGVLAER